MQLAILAAALVRGAIDPDFFSPLLPAPQHQSNGSTVLLVPSSFRFRLGAVAGR